MSNYSELLKDPRWQKKRLEIFQRDNWTCQHCLSEDKTLNVHHMRYADLPWEANNDWMVTLCCECHKIEEDLCEQNHGLKQIACFANIPVLLQLELIVRVIDGGGISEIHKLIKGYDHLYPDGHRLFYKNKIKGSAKIAQPDHEQSEVEKQ